MPFCRQVQCLYFLCLSRISLLSEEEHEPGEVSGLMSLIVGTYNILIDFFTKEELVGEENARGETIPDAGLNALLATLLSTINNTGLDNSIRTKITIAKGSTILLTAERRSIIGQLYIIGIALIGPMSRFSTT